VNAAEIQLQPDPLRDNLHAFRRESLEIAPTPDGLEVAVPQSFPDGWQIVLRLEAVTPTAVRLSDRGKTLCSSPKQARTSMLKSPPSGCVS
jgi:hypothetical protein